MPKKPLSVLTAFGACVALGLSVTTVPAQPAAADKAKKETPAAAKPAAGDKKDDKKPADKKDGKDKKGKKEKKKKEKHKAKAKDLLHDMERCVAFIGKAMKTERAKDKNLRSKKSKAFKEQLAATSKLVETLKKQAEAKDKAMFATSRQVDQAVAATDVTFKFAGIKNKDVASGVGKLKAAWEMYDKKFNRQALSGKDPKKAVAPLDAKKAAQLDEVKKKTDDLIAKLTALEAKLKKFKGLDAELNRIIAEAKTIKSATATYGAFITALDRLQDLEGAFKGLARYVKVTYPSLVKEFEVFDVYWVEFEKTVNVYYDEYYVSYDFAYYETTELEYTDTSIEVSISESEVSTYESYVESETTTESYDEVSESEATAEDSSYEADDADEDIDSGGDVDETDDEIAEDGEDMSDDGDDDDDGGDDDGGDDDGGDDDGGDDDGGDDDGGDDGED